MFSFFFQLHNIDILQHFLIQMLYLLMRSFFFFFSIHGIDLKMTTSHGLFNYIHFTHRWCVLQIHQISLNLKERVHCTIMQWILCLVEYEVNRIQSIISITYGWSFTMIGFIYLTNNVCSGWPLSGGSENSIMVLLLVKRHTYTHTLGLKINTF